MSGYQRTSRSFTIVELLAAMVVMGACILLAGHLSVHLIHALYGRTQSYDQLFLISRMSDRIRSDLCEPEMEVRAVEAHRLVIGSTTQTVEYRTKDTQIERVKSLPGKPPTPRRWTVPYAKLTFSQQEGKGGAVLVELHWWVGRSEERRVVVRKMELEMNVAARRAHPEPLETEGR